MTPGRTQFDADLGTALADWRSGSWTVERLRWVARLVPVPQSAAPSA